MSSFLYPDSATRKAFNQGLFRYETIRTAYGTFKQIKVRKKNPYKFRQKSNDVPKDSVQAKLAQTAVPKPKQGLWNKAKRFFKKVLR